MALNQSVHLSDIKPPAGGRDHYQPRARRRRLAVATIKIVHEEVIEAPVAAVPVEGEAAAAAPVQQPWWRACSRAGQPEPTPRRAQQRQRRATPRRPSRARKPRRKKWKEYALKTSVVFFQRTAKKRGSCRAPFFSNTMFVKLRGASRTALPLDKWRRALYLVGLGNLAPSMRKLRHNAGFRFLDALSLVPACRSNTNRVSTARLAGLLPAGHSVACRWLMNHSGESVAKLARFYTKSRRRKFSWCTTTRYSPPGSAPQGGWRRWRA